MRQGLDDTIGSGKALVDIFTLLWLIGEREGGACVKEESHFLLFLMMIPRSKSVSSSIYLNSYQDRRHRTPTPSCNAENQQKIKVTNEDEEEKENPCSYPSSSTVKSGRSLPPEIGHKFSQFYHRRWKQIP